jgi:hypothetical protein
MRKFRIVIEVENDWVHDGKKAKPVVVPKFIVQSSWLGVLWDRHPGTSVMGYQTREDAIEAVRLLSLPPLYLSEG